MYSAYIFMFFFFWSLKIYIYFFNFFANGHIHDVVSTFSNVLNIKIEIDNIDSTLLNFANFSFKKHNFVSTLLWHYLTAWFHINLTKTLKQRWNISWEGFNSIKNEIPKLQNIIGKKFHMFFFQTFDFKVARRTFKIQCYLRELELAKKELEMNFLN